MSEIEFFIERKWAEFVDSDPRLSAFDHDTLSGVKNIFKVGVVVGMREGADMCKRQIDADIFGGRLQASRN